MQLSSRLVLRLVSRITQKNVSTSSSRSLTGYIQECPYGPPLPYVPAGNFGRILAEKWLQYGTRIAMVDVHTKERITYPQLYDNVMRVAAGLAKDGFKKGDCLAIFSPNSIEYGILYFAATSLGGVVTTMNPVYTEAEILHILEDSEACMVGTTASLAPLVRNVVSKYRNNLKLKRIVTLEGESEGCIPLSHLAMCRESVPDVTCDPDDTCSLLYSSGTTGLPKGVMLTHRNLMTQIMQLSHPANCAVSPGVTVSCMPPMFHVFGLVIIMSNTLYNGGNVAVYPSYDPERFVRGIQDEQINVLHIPPPVLLLAKTDLPDRYDLSSATSTFFGAAPSGQHTIEMFKERFGLDHMCQMYGMTEMSAITHCNVMDVPRTDGVGFTVPGLQTKVVDTTTGEALGPDESGEVCFKGDTVMKGYHKNEAATKACITADGWLHSGDIGYYDEDGYFFIVDRLKELIKYKGYQVAPAELEKLLLTHPHIQDAAVIGVPQGEVGELPRAYIVPKPGSTLTEEEVCSLVAENAAPYKRLRGGVRFCEEIPKTGSGKILRRELRKISQKDI